MAVNGHDTWHQGSSKYELSTTTARTSAHLPSLLQRPLSPPTLILSPAQLYLLLPRLLLRLILRALLPLLLLLPRLLLRLRLRPPLLRLLLVLLPLPLPLEAPAQHGS